MKLQSWLIVLLVALAALIGAAAFGWWLGQPEPVQETAAPEQRQADGSVVLERKPDAKAKPAQLVPAGAKVERVGRVTVKPRSAHKGGSSVPMDPSSLYSADPCQPITVDWSLVREPDGGRRFLASSPDGTITAGVDVPVESAAPPSRPLRWAAGLSWSPIEETGGVWVERDIPLFSKAARLGLDVVQTRSDDHSITGADVRIRIGLAF